MEGSLSASLKEVSPESSVLGRKHEITFEDWGFRLSVNVTPPPNRKVLGNLFALFLSHF